MFALNVISPETSLAPAVWPADVPVEGLEAAQEQPLKGSFLAAALILLAADVLAALWVSGRLSGNLAARLGLVLALLGLAPAEVRAQSGDDAFALTATTELRLAYVVTGDARHSNHVQPDRRRICHGRAQYRFLASHARDLW